MIENETLAIDRAAIFEAGGSRAKVLFFPTAAYNSDDYIKIFSDYYMGLGVMSVDSAKIGNEKTDLIINKIRHSDLIYLGGGNTKKIIEDFVNNNLVNEVISFLDGGGVLVGISAGAMCLSATAVVSEYNDKLNVMAGLNIINNFVIVAHYDLCDEKNLKILKHMYPNKKVVAIPEKEALFIKDCDNIKLGKGIKIF